MEKSKKLLRSFPYSDAMEVSTAATVLWIVILLRSDNVGRADGCDWSFYRMAVEHETGVQLTPEQDEKGRALIDEILSGKDRRGTPLQGGPLVERIEPCSYCPNGGFRIRNYADYIHGSKVRESTFQQPKKEDDQ